MDGLDRLVEMLEKRFGKFWADALLLIAVLGAAAWGIHSIMAYLIFPALHVGSDFVAYLMGKHPWLSLKDILALIFEVVVLIALWALYFLVLRQRSRRWVKDANDAESRAKEMVSHMERCSECLQQKREEIAGFDALVAEHYREMMKARTRVATAVDLLEGVADLKGGVVPSPQSPQGTESDRQL